MNEFSDIIGIQHDLIKVYPNPTEGLINLNSKFKNDTKITISDVTGKKLIEIEDFCGDKTFDISQYNDGIYIFRILGENQVITVKVIKR